MTAIHLVSADALIESVFRVDPGKTVQRHIITSIASPYRLSEALFEDGHTEGPDNWDIETYKLNHDAAARGGVLLYDDGKSPRESGASLFFANIFSMQFKRIHGYGLSVQQKDPKLCVPIGKEGKEQPGYCPPPPKKNPPAGTPEIVGWGTVAVLNGNSTMSGDVCAQVQFFPVDLACYGTGACSPQPNPYMPGKVTVFVGIEVSGTCKTGEANVDASLINSPPPGSNWSGYDIAYSSAGIVGTGVPGEGWIADSCIAEQNGDTTGLTPCN